MSDDQRPLDPDTLSRSLAIRPEQVRAFVDEAKQRLKRGQFMVQVGEGCAVVFSPDGSVEVHGDVQPGALAMTFWTAMAVHNPLKVEIERLRAALEAVTKADCCGCSVYGRIARAALDGQPLPDEGT